MLSEISLLWEILENVNMDRDRWIPMKCSVVIPILTLTVRYLVSWCRGSVGFALELHSTISRYVMS